MTDQPSSHDSADAVLGELRWNFLIDGIPHPVWMKDSQSLYLAVNSTFCEYFGKTKEQVIGKSDFDIIKNAERATRNREEDYQVMTSKTRFVGRQSRIAEDGTERWMEIVKTPMLDAQGNLLGTIGILQDVTAHVHGEALMKEQQEHLEELVRERTAELLDLNASLQAEIATRKETELHLRTAVERAAQADRIKNNFIANISHEIRTPLNSILGFAELVELELQEFASEDQRAYFQHIREGSQRLMRTVEQILNLSSLQSGSVRFQPVEYDLAAHLPLQIRHVARLAEEKGLEIHQRIDGEDFLFQADAFMLDYCLNNILDNAVKFTQQGMVDIHLFRDGDFIQLDILDTGIGIAPEYLPKLFSTFSQEKEGYSRPFDGLGLGLALSKRYVEMNGGTISISSTLGAGTTVSLRFDRRKTASASPIPSALPPVEAPEVTAKEPGPSHRRPSILLVEDEEQTQKYMGLLLRRRFTVSTADSAAAAWEILEHQEVDLVFMDISLHGNENGLDLTRRIRAHSCRPTVPIVALTAFAFADDKARCFEAGCDDFLAKPFDRGGLEAVLSKYLPS